MTETEIRLHGLPLSGHCHRVELLLSMLGLPYRFIAAPAEVRRSEAFRQLNPLGQVPVVEDGDLVLTDSNAILVYLAKRYAPGSHWLPEAPEVAARVQRWLSIAAGELRYGPAAARVVTLWNTADDPTRARALAHDLLAFMEAHLAARSYLAAERPTIADLACYSYVAHAPEGGISLEFYQAVRTWLRNIEVLPGFKPMPASPLPEPYLAKPDAS